MRLSGDLLAIFAKALAIKKLTATGLLTKAAPERFQSRVGIADRQGSSRAWYRRCSGLVLPSNPDYLLFARPAALHLSVSNYLTDSASKLLVFRGAGQHSRLPIWMRVNGSQKWPEFLPAPASALRRCESAMRIPPSERSRPRRRVARGS